MEKQSSGLDTNTLDRGWGRECMAFELLLFVGQNNMRPQDQLVPEGLHPP